MAKDGKLKIGTCKARRNAHLPPTFVELNLLSGTVGKKHPGKGGVYRGAEDGADADSSSDEVFFDYLHRQ